MLSYMVPSTIDERPPAAPTNNKCNLQLILENHTFKNGSIPQSSNGTANTTYKRIMKTTCESNCSSTSSNGEVPMHGNLVTPTDRIKSRLSNGSAKTSLKRVSFGSSKGSMVETLIYETPVLEEPEPVSESHRLLRDRTESSDTYSRSEGDKLETSRVKVSFFESSEKKHVIPPNNYWKLSEISVHDRFTMSSPQSQNSFQNHYDRQESTDSGWDNPFRPDGDLSREADEIVELIKEGKPITPTQATPASKLDETPVTVATTTTSHASPKANGALDAATVDVQHGTVASAADASQVEHVVIKKKPKCKCCTIQ